MTAGLRWSPRIGVNGAGEHERGLGANAPRARACGNPTPLREADLRSLVLALENAVVTQPIDPLWQQMLSFAQDALP